MAGETILQLAERIRQMETSFRLCEPLRIPLGTCGLDALFPEEGLSAGSLVELLPRVPGTGAWTLALILARYACGERKTLLIADHARCFYPPAARKFGLDPARTVIVRPKSVGDALLAVAQALRCVAIGTVIGEFDRLTDRDSRRLQLAAEAGGTVGVLLRPISALGTPSFAAVRLLLDPLPSWRGRRRIKLEVLRSRTHLLPSPLGRGATTSSPLPCTQGRGAGGEGTAPAKNAMRNEERGTRNEELECASSFLIPRSSFLISSDTDAPSLPTPLPRSTGGEGSQTLRLPRRGEKELYLEIDDATGHVRAFSPVELAADLAPTA